VKTTLIIGGARSGKSTYAQETARRSGKKVLFVATAEAGDEEMRQRIEKHQQSRPAGWVTLEATDSLGSRIAAESGDAEIVIIDCVTLLVSNIFQRCGEEADPADVEKAARAEIDELIEGIHRVDADFLIVTNDVGLGLVPADSVSRLYRDILGAANQALARHADEVVLMVAGVPVPVKTSP